MQLLSECLWVKMAQCLILLELKKKSIEFQMLVNVEALCEGGEHRAHYGEVGNMGATHKATPSAEVTKHSLKLGLNSSAVDLYKWIITYYFF